MTATGEVQLRAVLDGAADAILVVDAAGTVRYANPATSTLFGEDLVGTNFGFPMSAGERTEIDIIRGDGRRVAEIRVTEIAWDGTPAYLAALRDVTERHVAETALHDFVSMVSHELRTPLATVRGFVDLLRDAWDTMSDEDRLHYIDTIGEQTDRMARMTSDLLLVSRMDADSMAAGKERVEVCRLLASTVEEHQHEEPVALDCDEGLSCWADPDHVRQIVLNFLTNAMKYGRPPYRVEARGDGEQVVIAVIDEGDGVPSSFVNRLFDRFSRGSHDGQHGTGLGLAIVRGLARAEGGDAWYEDNAPRGARFCVRLPAQPPT